jgi:NADPH:quinone reductase-like Zn-dependent oxidoreductase
MKAAILHSADSVPVYGDFDEPEAGPDREIVTLVAAGIHQLTRSVAVGRHYSTGGVFPVIPGLNAVARTAGGDLVFTSSAPPPFGTFAERIASPAAMRFLLPAGAPAEAVAAGVNPGMASWLPLTARRAEAGPLGTVLILGVTGISGYLAAQNARLLGAARVIGAGRNPAGLERAAAAGAQTIALTGDRATDAAAIAEALGEGAPGTSAPGTSAPGTSAPGTSASGAGAPGLVLDFVWGPVAETAFAALARSGFGEDDADIKYVQIGALGGPEAAVPSALLRSRKLTISGSGAGSVTAASIATQIPAYIKLIAEGSVQVPFRTFPLSDAGTAWTASSDSGPRVVLVPD